MEGVILGESLSKQHAVLRSGSKTNKPTEPFTSVAALQPKGVILKPKRLAKYSAGPIRTLLEALILSRGNQLLHITDYEPHTLLHVVERLHTIFSYESEQI